MKSRTENVSGIAIVLNHLSGGGADRNLARIADYLGKEGLEVDLIVLQDSEEEDIFPDAEVRVHRLHVTRQAKMPRHLLITARSIWALRKEFKRLKPQKVLSFCCRTNLLCLEASSGLGIPVIVSERSNPYLEKQALINRVRRRLWYPWAEEVVLLAEELNEWAASMWPRWSYSVIPNFIAEPIGQETAPSGSKSKKRKRILGLGRFVPEKGFDLLIDIFANLASDFPEWDLTLVGDGPEGEALQEIVHRRGLENRVILPGWVSNPYSYYYESDIFAFPSRFEGFGMTLAEALSCRLPAVAFDCPYGPSRIVENGINGFLVENGNTREFTERLMTLMKDDELRNRFSQAGVRVLEKYGRGSILDQWKTLICR